MAMLSCPECKKQISSTAISCPNCGYQLLPPAVPAHARKQGMPGWVIGLIVVACAIPVGIFIIGLLAAIAIPSFVNARQRSQQNACVVNLRLLETAKEEAARIHEHKQGDELPGAEMEEVLPGFSIFVCPAKGVYSVNPVGEDPGCSVHGTRSEAGQRGPVRSRPPPRPQVEPEQGR